MSRSRRTRTTRRKRRPASRRLRWSDTSVQSFLEKTFLVVLMLIPGVGWTTVATVQAMPDVRLAIDESAAPGTVTVTACEFRRYSNSSRTRWYCEGTFVYDVTGEAVQVIAHRRANPGDVYAARITPEGDRAVLRDAKGVLAHLGKSFHGLFLIGLALTGLMFFAPVNTLWPFVSAAAAVAVTGLVGSVAGFIASNT